MTQYGQDVGVDGAGNIVLVGSFMGLLNFGNEPLTSNGLFDIYLAKFDDFGNVSWSRKFGDASDQRGEQIALDVSGNIIMTGRFQGTVNFGGGDLTDAGEGDIFLVKFDPDGQHLWSRRFGDSTRQYGRDLAVDGAGNIILAGYHQGSVDFGGDQLISAGGFDAFLAKFAPDGQHLWSHGFGDDQGQFIESVAVDESGQITGAGFYKGSVDFGGGPLVGDASYRICVAKFSAQGQYIWARSFGEIGDQQAFGVAVDGWGDISLTGFLRRIARLWQRLAAERRRLKRVRRQARPGRWASLEPRCG